jgi:ADP-ribose pyrophosphatase YjhB (NUDIX family)
VLLSPGPTAASPSSKPTGRNYYKLPGGGVEGDEDHARAVEREVFEETGAHVAVQGPCFATVEEYRGSLHQLSHCYHAVVLDETGRPELTEDEVADGLCHEWVPMGEALEIMAAVEPTSELGRFIKERDIFLFGEGLNSKSA